MPIDTNDVALLLNKPRYNSLEFEGIRIVNSKLENLLENINSYVHCMLRVLCGTLEDELLNPIEKNSGEFIRYVTEEISNLDKEFSEKVSPIKED